MDSVLRDIDRERSKMQADMAELNRHFEKLRGYVYQQVQQSVVEWAKLVADHPKSLLLVVETTRMVGKDGYAIGGEDEPIRFTVLTLTTGAIWDQLLHPTYSEGVGGIEYHGLSLVDLENKPRLAEVWSDIVERLEDQHIVIFGADWARQAVRSVQHTNLLDSAFCLHNKCKEYYSQFYELSLEKILDYQGIDKRRDDLKDSRERIVVLAQVLRNLAAGMPKRVEEPEDSDLGDLSDHPF
jgi:DNA polymerase III epsilon subunit-like protein